MNEVKKASQLPKAKRWCFTLNNPTADDDKCEDWDPLTKYMIVGQEVGEEGTPHWQGYVEFLKEKRLTALKALIPRAHWEKCKGTPWQNFQYCSKDGQFKEWHEDARPTEPRSEKKKKSKQHTK